MTADDITYSHICRVYNAHDVQNLVNFTSSDGTKNTTQKITAIADQLFLDFS